jgi:hypothetical protein
LLIMGFKKKSFTPDLKYLLNFLSECSTEKTT